MKRQITEFMVIHHVYSRKTWVEVYRNGAGLSPVDYRTLSKSSTNRINRLFREHGKLYTTSVYVSTEGIAAVIQERAYYEDCD